MKWPAALVPSQQAFAPPSFWIESLTVATDELASALVPERVEFQPAEL